MQRFFLYLSLSVVLLIAGCAPLSESEQGAVTGGVVGAGVGAVAGDSFGKGGEGAVVGGATGALVGHALVEDQKYRERMSDEQKALLDKQKKRLDKQSREIEDLERQKYYDKKFERYEDK